MKTRWFAAVGLVCALMAPAACGVPGSGNPVDVGNAPTAGPPAVPASQQVPTPSSAKSPVDLVGKYFEAAAWGNTIGGDRPNAMADAQDSIRAYLTDDAAKQWQPGNGIRVARVAISGPGTEAGVGTFQVAATITPVGWLRDTGQVDPDVEAPMAVTFQAVPATGGGWRLATAPNDMWLSLDALAKWYQAQPIYFWDKATVPTLVPDLRYMPKVVIEAKRPDEIMRWLHLGPSQWLQGALDPLPSAIEVKDKIVPEQQRLVVNLTRKAAGVDPAALLRVAVQLRWSLRPKDGIDLRVEGTSTGASTNDYLSANRAVRPDGNTDPEKFCVVNLRVRATDLNSARSTPVLDHEANAGVSAAAITGDKTRAALVVSEGKAKRLYIGSTTGKGDTTATSYVKTDVLGDIIGRPTWIFRPDTRVLVIVSGQIYAVTAPAVTPPATTAAAPATKVILPPGIGAVSALSVAPDGRRIALVSGGRVFVAPLDFPPAGTDQLAVGRPREVVTGLASQLAVGWGDETSLVVGGAPLPNTNFSLAEIAIDGTGERYVPRLGSDGRVVTSLTTRPANPLNPLNSNPVPSIMFEANNQAYDVFSQVVGQLKLDVPTPSPSAPAGPNSVPRAPFFLD